MEEQEENKKVTLLDQLSIAVSSPKNYKQLVKLKTGRLVWFVVIISFLTGIYRVWNRRHILGWQGRRSEESHNK